MRARRLARTLVGVVIGTILGSLLWLCAIGLLDSIRVFSITPGSQGRLSEPVQEIVGWSLLVAIAGSSTVLFGRAFGRMRDT